MDKFWNAMLVEDQQDRSRATRDGTEQQAGQEYAFVSFGVCRSSRKGRSPAGMGRISPHKLVPSHLPAIVLDRTTEQAMTEDVAFGTALRTGGGSIE